MSEAFVNNLRRDYLDGADRSRAAILLSQVSGWITDYNERAPHSALGNRNPVDFRDEQRADPEEAVSFLQLCNPVNDSRKINGLRCHHGNCHRASVITAHGPAQKRYRHELAST